MTFSQVSVQLRRGLWRRQAGWVVLPPAYCKRDTEEMVRLTKFLLGGKTKALRKKSKAAHQTAR